MALWNPFARKPKTENPPAEPPAPTPAAHPEQAPVADGSVREKLAELTPQPTVPTLPERAALPVQPVVPAVPSLPVQSAPEPSEKPAKIGIFGRIKNALRNTIQVLNTDIRDLVKDGRLVDDEFLDELYLFLVKTDMGNRPAAQIRDDIKSKFRGRKVFLEDLIKSAKSTIREIMQQEGNAIARAASGPTVIMVVGVNGSGKTTSIAKLTHRFRSKGDSVVLGAGDTFRAAAVEQLTIWSQRLGAEIVTGRSGSDPASVAYKAVEAAKNQNLDVCIIDTAGRLQTQTNLMDELSRIKRVISKVIPEAPHEVLLVLDATAGQNAISQAKGFSAAAGCTGIILAKLDGTAKGGVAIPIRQEFNLPVKFIGLGETPDAFADFQVDPYVDALFDPN
jgi:fused signal recognition particle receptor